MLNAKAPRAREHALGPTRRSAFLFKCPTDPNRCRHRQPACQGSGHDFAFVDIQVRQRKGKSCIRPKTDCIRFLNIFLKIATLKTLLGLFVPISGIFFLTALGNYVYTYASRGQLANSSPLLLSTAFIILTAPIPESISTFHYFNADQK
jgi:hypothetical protein